MNLLEDPISYSIIHLASRGEIMCWRLYLDRTRDQPGRRRVRLLNFLLIASKSSTATIATKFHSQYSRRVPYWPPQVQTSHTAGRLCTGDADGDLFPTLPYGNGTKTSSIMRRSNQSAEIFLSSRISWIARQSYIESTPGGWFGPG